VVTGIRESESSSHSGCLRPLQWGPVVVTGIRHRRANEVRALVGLQWGPVVVTGISSGEWKLSLCAVLLQWGPVVVTGISRRSHRSAAPSCCFNGVRSW